MIYVYVLNILHILNAVTKGQSIWSYSCITPETRIHYRGQCLCLDSFDYVFILINMDPCKIVCMLHQVSDNEFRLIPPETVICVYELLAYQDAIQCDGCKQKAMDEKRTVYFRGHSSVKWVTKRVRNVPNPKRPACTGTCK